MLKKVRISGSTGLENPEKPSFFEVHIKRAVITHLITVLFDTFGAKFERNIISNG